MMNIERYSSYQKLLRITSYVLRFINNSKQTNKHKKTGHLEPSEMQNSAEIWIRDSQSIHFSQEYQTLRKGGRPRNSLPIIRQLRLYIDEKNLIRCGGRMHNAPLPETTKFPYLLPNNHRLTKLIIMDAHERICHSGTNATVIQVRQSFWIPAIRQLVKKTIHRCVTCRKVNGQSYPTPDPPPLQKLRLQEAPPFTTTGIDFTGALYVRNKDHTLSKCYICLLTCASTRAIHLEVVQNLSEETFLQAFRRFCSRTSTPKFVMSDNANTFKAASEEIRRIYESETIRQSFTDKGIEWKFIPTRAPWFGGWWERLIGLTKTSLKKVLGKSLIDLDSLHTIVTEIEAVLNDRPLTSLSSDPDDLEPLTPAHLLYGRKLCLLPYPYTKSGDLQNFKIDTNCLRKQSRR